MWLDGLIARRYGSGSQLGIFFDLVGDKLVVAALVITMVELGWIPGWIAVGFIGREIFVMGMRAYAGAQGVTVSAGQLGKMKMMWQYIGLAALIWDRVPLTWAHGDVRVGHDACFRPLLSRTAFRVNCAAGPHRTFQTRFEVRHQHE